MIHFLLWGGLRPIARQVVIDNVAVLGMIASAMLLGYVRPGQSSSPPPSRQQRRMINVGTILLLLTGCWILFTTSGWSWSNRWTLTIPFVPLALLHFLHRQLLLLLLLREFPPKTPKTGRITNPTPKDLPVGVAPPKFLRVWNRRRLVLLFCSWILTTLGWVCIGCAAALSVLFPAVELPLVQGPYRVGAVDFFLPMFDHDNNNNDDMRRLVRGKEPPRCTPSGTTDNEEKEEDASGATCSAAAEEQQQYLPVRLLYPTLEQPNNTGRLWFGKDTTIPFLNPTTAIAFCHHSMKFGAPPPLKPFGWMLHTWRLVALPILRHATPYWQSTSSLSIAADDSSVPLVVFSHGLGGTLDLYSYQTMTLASYGSVVLTVTHLDGTAPIVPQPNGREALRHNHDILKLFQQGKVVEYVQARRMQTEQRAHELIQATDFLRNVLLDDQLHESDIDTRVLRTILKGVKFNHTTFIGHSHGGATVLTAASRRRDLVNAVVAHEPAIDWAPDDCRMDMFPSERLENLSIHYNGGTGQSDNFYTLESEKKRTSTDHSIHDVNLLILNSHQWLENGWGSVALLKEMFRNDRWGQGNGKSKHYVIENATHNEFSDTSMLTPLWLARQVGLSGPRNPLDTAAEIAAYTEAFLEDVRQL